MSIYHLVCDVSAQVACVMSCVSSDYGGNLSLGAHYTGDGQVIRRHWTTLVPISPGLGVFVVMLKIVTKSIKPVRK